MGHASVSVAWLGIAGTVEYRSKYDCFCVSHITSFSELKIYIIVIYSKQYLKYFVYTHRYNIVSEK